MSQRKDPSPKLADANGRRTKFRGGDTMVVSFDPNDANVCVGIRFLRNGQPLEFQGMNPPGCEHWFDPFICAETNDGAPKMRASRLAMYVVLISGLKMGTQTFGPAEERFEFEEY